MGLLLIVVSQVVHLVEGMLTRTCSKKHGDGGLIFNSLISFFSMIFFVVSDRNGFYFPKELWVYGLVSGLCYAGGFYYMFRALQIGSFGMTRLLSSFGLIITIFYGLLFLQEPAGYFTYIGIFLILISIFFTNMGKITKEDRKMGSGKWLICVIASILCNGGIGILSRMQQIHFNEKCDNEFLIISLAISFILMGVLGLIKDRSRLKEIFKNSIWYSFGAGTANGLKNLLRMITYLYIPMSVMAPLSSGIGIVLGFVVSILLYREKFTKLQFAGVIVGIAAVVLLKL